jgi:hypothetical protein
LSSDVLRVLRQRGLSREEHRPVQSQISRWELRTFQAAESAEAGRAASDPPAPGSDHERYEELRRLATMADSNGDSGSARLWRAEADAIRVRNLVTVTNDDMTPYLPRDIALHYLSLCAARIARDLGRDVVTNQERFTDVVLTSDAQLRGEVATALLEAYVPDGLYTMDPARLAECRAELSAKRLAFQAEIQSLVDSLSKAASVDTYNTVKAQLIELANERVEQTKRAYRNSQFGLSTQALGVSLTPPALFTAAASALHIGLLGPIGLSAALSLFTAVKVIEWRQARADRERSPWSYVLDLSRRVD